MQDSYFNYVYMLNGRVKPPIVLRSNSEQLIAQNAHNLVWGKYRNEYDELCKEGANQIKGNERWVNMYARAQQQINELIITEINAYREARAKNPFADIEERLERLENEMNEIRSIAEEAQEMAEEAQSTAEEALESVNDEEDK